MRKYSRAVKRSPVSDPQRERVYRMENEAIGARNYLALTRRTLGRLARSICRAYRLPKVDIRYADLGHWAAEWREPNVIVFGRKTGARDFLTAAHELAHHLHHHIEPTENHEAHGPQFMGCYMSVLDTCRLIPVAAMRVICETYRIKFVDPGDRSNYTALVRAVKAP